MADPPPVFFLHRHLRWAWTAHREAREATTQAEREKLRAHARKCLQNAREYQVRMEREAQQG